jgi:hypothetical protein
LLQLSVVFVVALVPGAPVSVSTNATSNSVTVMWQSPTDVHQDNPVVKYVLGWVRVPDTVDKLNPNHPWNDSVNLKSMVTTYTIRGLLPNTRYSFKVGAFSNASNFGSFSEWVEQRTYGKHFINSKVWRYIQFKTYLFTETLACCVWCMITKLSN